MATIEVKNFEKDADEVSTPNNARVETVNISGQRVMKLTIQPGWKWSDDIKPLVGTDSCKAKHLGVIVEGSITCRHDDGTQVTYSAGDAMLSTQDMMLGLKEIHKLLPMNFMALGVSNLIYY